jgi:hypothetical protein
MLPTARHSRFSLPGFGQMGMWYRSLLLDAVQSAELIRTASK